MTERMYFIFLFIAKKTVQHSLTAISKHYKRAVIETMIETEKSFGVIISTSVLGALTVRPQDFQY